MISPQWRCRALAVALVLLAAAQAGAQLTYVPPAVPPGFVVETLTETLSEPVGLALLPDGRALIIERTTGAIKVWAGGLNAPLVGVVPGVNSGAFERGLLAIAVDPSMARPALRLRLVRLDRDREHAPLDVHRGGRPDEPREHEPRARRPIRRPHRRPGPRGDPQRRLAPLRPRRHALREHRRRRQSVRRAGHQLGVGCVLRMDVSSLPEPDAGPPLKATLVPAGNPFSGPTDNARLIWCHGLRNPFRFHIDPVTGHLHIADVGAALVDEIDECVAGGQNFGWPWLEANLNGLPCTGTPPATVHPITVLNHNGAPTAVMSFGRYRNAIGGRAQLRRRIRRRLLLLRVLLGADAPPAVQRRSGGFRCSGLGPARVERVGNRVPGRRRHRARSRRRALLREAVQRAPDRTRSGASAAIPTRRS